jgi:hypothetical protein
MIHDLRLHELSRVLGQIHGNSELTAKRGWNETGKMYFVKLVGAAVRWIALETSDSRPNHHWSNVVRLGFLRDSKIHLSWMWVDSIKILRMMLIIYHYFHVISRLSMSSALKI